MFFNQNGMLEVINSSKIDILRIVLVGDTQKSTKFFGFFLRVLAFPLEGPQMAKKWNFHVLLYFESFMCRLVNLNMKNKPKTRYP